MPDPADNIRISDSLVVIGTKETLKKLAANEEFIELGRELPINL
jgi:K+/H+ antiporter YhaU regulatory subunit KhtT